MLRNFDIIQEEPTDILETYFQQCAIRVTCRDLALMAATLANNGRNPLTREQAMLRYDGKTVLQMVGNVAMSFFCGPYLMLQMGWQQERGGTLSLSMALVSAFVAFGWAFITGLVVLGGYFTVFG